MCSSSHPTNSRNDSLFLNIAIEVIWWEFLHFLKSQYTVYCRKISVCFPISYSPNQSIFDLYQNLFFLTVTCNAANIYLANCQVGKAHMAILVKLQKSNPVYRQNTGENELNIHKILIQQWADMRMVSFSNWVRCSEPIESFTWHDFCFCSTHLCHGSICSHNRA